MNDDRIEPTLGSIDNDEEKSPSQSKSIDKKEHELNLDDDFFKVSSDKLSSDKVAVEQNPAEQNVNDTSEGSVKTLSHSSPYNEKPNQSDSIETLSADEDLWKSGTLPLDPLNQDPKQASITTHSADKDTNKMDVFKVDSLNQNPKTTDSADFSINEEVKKTDHFNIDSIDQDPKKVDSTDLSIDEEPKKSDAFEMGLIDDTPKKVDSTDEELKKADMFNVELMDEKPKKSDMFDMGLVDEDPKKEDSFGASIDEELKKIDMFDVELMDEKPKKSDMFDMGLIDEDPKKEDNSDVSIDQELKKPDMFDIDLMDEDPKKQDNSDVSIDQELKKSDMFDVGLMDENSKNVHNTDLSIEQTLKKANTFDVDSIDKKQKKLDPVGFTSLHNNSISKNTHAAPFSLLSGRIDRFHASILAVGASLGCLLMLVYFDAIVYFILSNTSGTTVSDGYQTDPMIYIGISSGVLLVSYLIITMGRLRDIGRSPSFGIILFLFPLTFAIIFMIILPGTPESNKYGPVSSSYGIKTWLLAGLVLGLLPLLIYINLPSIGEYLSEIVKRFNPE